MAPKSYTRRLSGREFGKNECHRKKSPCNCVINQQISLKGGDTLVNILVRFQMLSDALSSKAPA